MNPATPPIGSTNAKMLFLASHGFQTPISAIRWGCGRLRKMAPGMPEQERALINGIQHQSRILSQMFDAMLLLAKVEDGIHTGRVQDVYLKDFFLNSTRIDDLPADVTTDISCPEHARLRIDRGIFETIVMALLTVVDAAGEGKRKVQIDVQIDEQKEVCDITFHTPLEFSLVEQDERLRSDERRIVGGVPGMMLAIVSSLSSSVGGTLEVEEGPQGFLRIRLPAPPSVSVLPEA